MIKVLLIIFGITAGIVISTNFIESRKLTQGPESRPAARAQQLDDFDQEDLIETRQAAPLEITE
jgi:hypothetical protein